MQQLFFGKEARDKVKSGIDKTVNMVKVTLGFKGRNVLIKPSYISNMGRQYLPARYSKDGVTVARHIELPDAIENAGCDLVKDAAGKTVALAGDGTTQTSILLQAIAEKGLELVDAGANPMEVKEGIDLAVEKAVIALKAMATPVSGSVERIKQVATISANNDSSIGELIAKAFETIGEDGIIDLEESKTATTEIKVTDGVRFERGWVSPYFINNPAKGECELVNPYILLYDKDIRILKELEGVLGQIMQAGASLLIVCNDADGEALAALAMNAAQKRLNVCVVRCPELGEKKIEAMEDLASLVGGIYISTEKGTSLSKATISQLGKADKVIVGQNSTTIISGKGDKGAIATIVGKLKEDAKKADPIEKEQLEKRIATLTGGVAVLYVGAATEVEMKEKKDRCDDAVKAVRAALKEGFVPGGGVAFLRIGYFTNTNSTDLGKGISALNEALKAPFLQLCTNAGIDGHEKMKEVLAATGNVGYNGKTEQIEDLLESGVIDACMALRVALENAASAAGAVITSEGLIV